MTLVLAWMAFWLNSALFPCCDALAAAFSDHSSSVSQSVSASQPTHHSDETHSEQSHHSPDSFCCYTLIAGLAIDEVYAGLPPDRIDLEYLVIATTLAPGLIAASQSEYLAPRDYHPPPPYRLYLQTQRLLI